MAVKVPDTTYSEREVYGMLTEDPDICTSFCFKQLDL